MNFSGPSKPYQGTVAYRMFFVFLFNQLLTICGAVDLILYKQVREYFLVE